MPVPHLRIPIWTSHLSPEPNAVTMATRLWPRVDDPNGPSSQKPTKTSIIVALVVAVIVLVLSITLTLRAIRARHPNPRYVPTPFFKRLWTNWKVPAVKHAYAQAGIDEEYNTRNRANQDNMEEALTAVNGRTAAAGGSGAAGGTTAEVNRNQSIRSIMTLPAYRPAPAENERVLGREGERDGIDVVVEMPTAEDEEHLRDEEMEALYQIRVARRRANQEREERRRLRQEARQTHNSAALRQIREQARVQTTRNTEELEVLREEHNRIRELRSRATSSVQYADLGVARADGTRIRANSTESERVGLLSDAASMAASQQGGRPSTSAATHHRRGSSSLSVDTSRLGDQFLDSPAIATPLTGAGGSSTFSIVTRDSQERGRSISRSRANSSANTPRAGSSPEMIDADDADLGAVNMPPPPGYEDVRLDDLTPFRSPVASAAVSGRNSPTSLTPLPYSEPPPEYPGPSPALAPLAEETSSMLSSPSTRTDGGRTLAHQRSISGGGSVGAGNLPTRLPSLRLDSVPLIVVEPEEESRTGESGNKAGETSAPPNINITPGTPHAESSTARNSVSESFRTSTESDSGEETPITTKGKEPERIPIVEQVEKEKGSGSGSATVDISRAESTRSTTAARDKESQSPPVGEGITRNGSSARTATRGAEP
ncbi:hypothetical protein B0T09DRAFT_185731 [Sordaria sp. MPI-SDFR-AT-0083]|nr:hypothetical protein B0T09DRAFT_185731 [Sordaria sp. MPI-SDFR-AT-0083]